MSLILNLLAYKSWSNELMFSSLDELSESELFKDRDTYFNNIISTANHIYVVDDIFKAHLSGEKHSYKKRYTDIIPSLYQLKSMQIDIDNWYMSYIKGLNEEELSQLIYFEYIGGEKACMTIFEIVVHLVNHAANHRGHIAEMLCKTDVEISAHDFSVFLRDKVYI